MSPKSPDRPDFVPTASIIAFVFIGVIVLIGLILRCVALNHSNIRSAHSNDLMIYQPAPRPAPAARPRRSSNEQKFDSNSANKDPKSLTDGSVTPTGVRRVPKNL